jgi:FtsP/CotA-like multicopper oxidase with cupredoxin domain
MMQCLVSCDDEGAGHRWVYARRRTVLGEKSVRADVGETQLWTIINKAIWAHFFFQEVDENGVPVSPPAWKDTIHVAVDATKRFLVKLDRPGSWTFHCHILDHAEAGLMSTVDVGDIDAHRGEHSH